MWIALIETSHAAAMKKIYQGKPSHHTQLKTNAEAEARPTDSLDSFCSFLRGVSVDVRVLLLLSCLFLFVLADLEISHD